MRLVAGAGALAAIVLLPGVAAAAPEAAPHGTTSASSVHEDITALRIAPWAPRRDSDVRILVRCPKEATDAIVASTAFGPGPIPPYRTAYDIGLDDSDFGWDTEPIPAFARLGEHTIVLRCVKVVVDPATLLRTITKVSKLYTTVFVRPHITPSLKCTGVGFVKCHGSGTDPKKHSAPPDAAQ